VAQALSNSMFQSILLSLGQSINHNTALCISNYYISKVCQWLAAGQWFSPGTVFRFPPSMGTNKTDRHDITEILLKVALSTLTLYTKMQVAIWIWIIHHAVIAKWLNDTIEFNFTSGYNRYVQPRYRPPKNEKCLFGGC